MECFKEFVIFLCEHLFILFSSSFLSLCDRLACVGSARIAHGFFLLCVDKSYEPISPPVKRKTSDSINRGQSVVNRSSFIAIDS